MDQEIIKKKQWGGALCIFVIGFLFFYFLTENLPFWMYGPDDFTFLAYSNTESLSDIFTTLFTLNPEPVRGYHIDENILPHRIILVLFFKVASLIGGINPYSHYLVRGIIYGLVGMFVFHFLHLSTGKSFLSMMGALFYITAPATFASGQWLADGELILQVFLGITFALFLYVFFSSRSRLQLIPWQVLITVFSYVAVRTKANGVVIPFVMILYILLTDYRKIKQWALCISVIVILMYPYWVPLFFSEDSGENITTFNTNNVLSYFLFNKYTTLDEGEQGVSLFLPLQHFHVIPAALLSMFGFLGGWLLIIAGIVTIYACIRKYSGGAKYSNKEKCLHYPAEAIQIFDNNLPQLYNHQKLFPQITEEKDKLILFFLLWSGITSLIMVGYLQGRFPDNQRYVAIVLFPFSILAFLCYYTLIEKIKRVGWKCQRKIQVVVILIYILLISTMAVNAYHTAISFRGGFLSRHVGMDVISKTIYSDYYGTNSTNHIYLSLNSNCEFRSDFSSVDALSLSEFSSWGVGQGEITKDNVQRIIDTFGLAYIVTLFRPLDKESIEINVTLIKEFKSCDDQSFYCEFKHKIKKDNPFLFIYKVTSENLSANRNYSIICPFGSITS